MSVIESISTDCTDYPDIEAAFGSYLHDLADEYFVYDSYREGQKTLLYQTLDGLFVEDKSTVVIDGPTAVGKSVINAVVAMVNRHLYENKSSIERHFNIHLDAVENGKSFYTTPQTSLRDQLGNDEDINEYLEILKSRSSYTCAKTGSPCNTCPVLSDPDSSCVTEPQCTYWDAKTDAIDESLSVLTFAMLIVDANLPPETDSGEPLSFEDRDILICDEGHGLEGQAASLFAGFTVSPYSLPLEVFGDTGEQVSWRAERIEDVSHLLTQLRDDAEEFVDEHDDTQGKETDVRQCENYLRKYRYMMNEVRNEDRPWVVNVDEVQYPNEPDTTKKIELQPVDVDRFLHEFVWSRANKQILSSATIPFRDNIERWTQRLGIHGDVKLVDVKSPIPKEHRLIHTNTVVGAMSGDNEERNWHDACRMIEMIQSNHEGEKGLIHTNSYQRAEKVRDALGEELIMKHDEDLDTSVMIHKWQDSDVPMLASPSMMEGIDLYEDKSRFQILLKVPFGVAGDSRISYLLNERSDWNWYYVETSSDIQQSVGRAVRGTEKEEAASYYVLDSKFDEVMNRTSPPNWFKDAITSQEPAHWDTNTKAPWR